MSKFYSDYTEARAYAQKRANEHGLFFRVKRVDGPLEKGYVVRGVPSPAFQYGGDLEGELVRSDISYSDS